MDTTYILILNIMELYGQQLGDVSNEHGADHIWEGADI